MTYSAHNLLARIRQRLKAPNFGATAGQTIAGNLERGAGGQFTSGGSSSSSGSNPNKTNPEKPVIPVKQRIEQRRQTREKTLQSAGLNASEAAALIALLSGPVTELRAASLLKLGLASVKKDGSIVATAIGRMAAAFAAKGDLEGTQKALAAALDKQQERDERTRVAADRKRRRQELQELRRRQRQNRDVKRETEERKKATFSVYKQADGRYRWVASSSNAYRDRDDEIVSTKALEQAVSIGDKTGYRGPLRWWHMPGVDLGVCDFQAMHGRFLVESGTFSDERIGRAIATKAADLQLSIGFTHPPYEPDADGVFHNIAIFERSLVPAGRAANALTQLVIKGTTMDQAKIEALKSLGIDESLLSGLLSTVEHKDTTAQAAGLSFKSDEGSALWTEEEVKELADALIPHLTAPLAEAATQKTVAAFKELATLFSGALRQKDDAITAANKRADEQAKTITALDKRLKALEGEQPPAFYRATQDPNTAQNTEALKSLGMPGPDSADPFAEILQGLGFNGVAR